MISVGVLGTEGKTGQAVIARLQQEPGYSYQPDLSLCNLVVASPGIPPHDYPNITAPIISEVELAYKLNPTPIIGVTGTNGKTTTTALIAHILDVPAVGNIGVPYISVTKPYPYLVVELSSYQLYGIKEFCPYISIVLNISEDHLAWHGDMDGYVAAKANIFKNQAKQNYLIYNIRDQHVREMVKKSACAKLGFWSPTKLGEDFAAAKYAALLCGKDEEYIDYKISTFTGVAHRLEKVGEYAGVRYINDSKATNVDAAVVALDSEPRDNHIVLIAGGQDKHTDLAPLKEAMQGRVKQLILLGEAKERFAEYFGDFNVVEVTDYEQAVQQAVKLSGKGDVVLLSPACASWDMFDNFEQRGEVFKELVHRYAKPL